MKAEDIPRELAIDLGFALTILLCFILLGVTRTIAASA